MQRVEKGCRKWRTARPEGRLNNAFVCFISSHVCRLYRYIRAYVYALGHPITVHACTATTPWAKPKQTQAAQAIDVKTNKHKVGVLYSSASASRYAKTEGIRRGAAWSSIGGRRPLRVPELQSIAIASSMRPPPHTHTHTYTPSAWCPHLCPRPHQFGHLPACLSTTRHTRRPPLHAQAPAPAPTHNPKQAPACLHAGQQLVIDSTLQTLHHTDCCCVAGSGAAGRPHPPLGSAQPTRSTGPCALPPAGCLAAHSLTTCGDNTGLGIAAARACPHAPAQVGGKRARCLHCTQTHPCKHPGQQAPR